MKSAESLLGKVSLDASEPKQERLLHLLLKPSNLLLEVSNDEKNSANAQVEYISVTEQGYHYYLSSLNDVTKDESMAFSKLSIYSDIALSLKQKVALSIRPHEYLFFDKPT